MPGDMALGLETQAPTATSDRQCGALPSADWTDTSLFAAATRAGRLGVIGSLNLRQITLGALLDANGNPDEVETCIGSYGTAHCSDLGRDSSVDSSLASPAGGFPRLTRDHLGHCCGTLSDLLA
jgi:hypothetical protein